MLKREKRAEMSQPPLDTSVIEELREATGPEFAQELIATFLDEAPGMMQELQDALASADAEGFRRAAHSLKSNASTFGALALADQARQLEMQGLDIAGNETALPALQRAYVDATAALKAYVDE